MTDAEKRIRSFLEDNAEKGRIVTLSSGDITSECECNVILIIEGIIDVYLVSFDGGETLVSTLTSGQITGISNIFSESGINTRIVCRKDSTLRLFPDSWVKDSLIADKALFSAYAVLLNEKIQFLTERIGQLSSSLSVVRLAEFLILAGDDKLTKFKKSDIAKATHMSRASFYRALKELEERNIISLEGGDIRIKDRSGLLSFLEKS